MGLSLSVSEEFKNVKDLFTEHEHGQMNEIFKKICGEQCNSFGAEKLQNYLQSSISDDITKRLTKWMANCIASWEGSSSYSRTQVFFEAFVVGLSHVLKGSIQERGELFLRLSTDNPQASSSELLQFVTELGRSYTSTIASTAQYESWNLDISQESLVNLASSLLQELFCKGGDVHYDAAAVPPGQNFAEMDIEKWLSSSPLVLHMMDYVFHKCFNVSFVEGASSCSRAPRLPLCLGAVGNHIKTILNIPAVLLLNQNLPVEHQGEWKLLFSSCAHGESFSTLLHHIVDKGPTILVIKDKDGHIFGGFASESWTVRPQFAGCSRCFLFSVAPHLGVYSTTGINDNYMYLNNAQQTMPNGLGMGGQFEYFGLWLDSEYSHGHSRAEPRCTTYNSPQLSSKPHFQLSALEVWRVGPEPKKSEEEEDKRSILDKDPAAKAMLSLLDKGPVSEGLRQRDPTADTPEDHSLPPL